MSQQDVGAMSRQLGRVPPDGDDLPHGPESSSRTQGQRGLETAQLCLDLRSLQLVDLLAQHRHAQEHGCVPSGPLTCMHPKT
jgi:hypothetical protein